MAFSKSLYERFFEISNQIGALDMVRSTQEMMVRYQELRFGRGFGVVFTVIWNACRLDPCLVWREMSICLASSSRYFSWQAQPEKLNILYHHDARFLFVLSISNCADNCNGSSFFFCYWAAIECFVPSDTCNYQHWVGSKVVCQFFNLCSKRSAMVQCNGALAGLLSARFPCRGWAFEGVRHSHHRMLLLIFLKDWLA